MAHDIGEQVLRSVLIRTAAGAPVNADALPVYTITLPDGSAGVSPTVNPGSIGEYWVAYTAGQAGVYVDRWTATVAGLAVVYGPDTFRVRGTSAAPLLSLEDARRAVGVGVDAIRDEQLRDDLDAATASVERETGRRWRRTTITAEEHIVDCARAVLLDASPVLAITSVTVDGVALTASDYVLRAAAGILTVAGGGTWSGTVEVSYTAGTSTPPDDVLRAVRLQLQHDVATRRGASGAPRRAAAGADPLAVELQRALAALPHRLAFA